jgi:hypothetical protein
VVSEPEPDAREDRPLERQHERGHEGRREQDPRRWCCAPHAPHARQIDHAHSDREEHAREARERHRADEVPAEEHHRQHRDGGGCGGQTRLRTTELEQGRAREAGRGRERADEGARDVGRSLRHDLAPHVRPRATTPSRHRELDRAEQRDRRGRTEQVTPELGVERRQRESRPALRHACAVGDHR